MRAVFALVVLVACWKQPVPPRPPAHDAQLAVRVTRQDGMTVLEGEAWCYQFSKDAKT